MEDFIDRLRDYFAYSLDKFFEQNPDASRNPNLWKSNHKNMKVHFLKSMGLNVERKYGGMTDGIKRFNDMKVKLPIKLD